LPAIAVVTQAEQIKHMKLWLDVDDLFHFSKHSGRPTGIQRLTGEVYLALIQGHLDEVGFVRHADSAPEGFVVLCWQEVQDIYHQLAYGHKSNSADNHSTQNALPFMRRLHNALRFPHRLSSHRAQNTEPVKPALVDLAKPGDFLCTLGAPWHDENYQLRVSKCVDATGMSFAILIHDLIPLVRPEYFELGRAPHFEPVIRGALISADVILANSKATAADVSAWAAQNHIVLKSAPHPIPLGSGFQRPRGGQLPPGVLPGEYVLLVSTIEVRKNHLQAFRIWSRLLQEMPHHKVPKLVFAGAWGWMVEDLRKAIEATHHLDNKLVVVSSPDDATLAALYRGCQFTLYPSYYEGWGLPVSDSLAFGKVCVASNRTSIPEAGGPHCIYIDPDNTTDALARIKELIEDSELLRRLEAQLLANFKPKSWSDTADAVVRILRQRTAPSIPNPSREPGPMALSQFSMSAR
jgi:glycosyltransferase involved in cell wall biosynthesis